MNLFKKLFAARKSNSDLKSALDEEISIEGFQTLSPDKRMIIVINYGDTGNLKYYPLLKYSITNDPDINVKFSALKRIHLFIDDPDCKRMLIDLENQLNTQSLEPYYSMALNRTGIISLDDFKGRISKS